MGVSVSALARTGTMFTFSCRAFINSTSKGRRLEIGEKNKGGGLSKKKKSFKVPSNKKLFFVS